MCKPLYYSYKQITPKGAKRGKKWQRIIIGDYINETKGAS